MRPALLACLLVISAAGCRPDEEAPRTLVSAPRVLAIVADPPEVAPGESSTVTILVVGTSAPPGISWSACRLPPLPGQTTHPDCLTAGQGPELEPIGEGATVTATMPGDVTPEVLGQPDASGGVYLSLVAHVSAAADVLSAVYRLRLATSGDRNRNPAQTAVVAFEPGGAVALDPAVPRPVRPAERLGLAVTLADGTVESYVAPRGGPTGGPVTEVVRTAWFSTAGEFSNDYTNAAQPTTELILERFLPPSGSAIDVYAVTRDERGGANFSHRTLRLE